MRARARALELELADCPRTRCVETLEIVSIELIKNIKSKTTSKSSFPRHTIYSRTLKYEFRARFTEPDHHFDREFRYYYYYCNVKRTRVLSELARRWKPCTSYSIGYGRGPRIMFETSFSWSLYRTAYAIASGRTCARLL